MIDKKSSNNENAVAIACAEGDKITKVLIEETRDSQWVMRWDLLQPNGRHSHQNFWGNESLRKVDGALLENQFIQEVAIVHGDLKITTSKAIILFPVLFTSQPHHD